MKYEFHPEAELEKLSELKRNVACFLKSSAQQSGVQGD
jgi:hypothetical protein